MKNTWRHHVGRPYPNEYHEFKSLKVYNAFRERIRQDINERDTLSSITGRFLRAGFTSKDQISPKDNWFGASLYHPEVLLKKGDKQLFLSLQSFGMPYPKTKEDEALLKSCSCKYIELRAGNEIIYQSWCGNLPSKEIEEEFLKS